MTDKKREAEAEAIRQRIAQLQARGAAFRDLETAYRELFALHQEKRP